MRIQPASKGLLVPYPGGSRTYLPAEGAEVPDGERHWLRALNRHDVILIVEEGYDLPPGLKKTTVHKPRSTGPSTAADKGVGAKS